jgi:predicted nucleotide-binding protein
MSLFDKWFTRNWRDYSFKKWPKTWGTRLVGKREGSLFKLQNSRIVLIWDFSNGKPNVSNFAEFLKDFDKFYDQYDSDWVVDGAYLILYSEYDKTAFNVLFKGMDSDLRDLVTIKILDDKKGADKAKLKESEEEHLPEEKLKTSGNFSASEEKKTPTLQQRTEKSPRSSSIFIVHGRDKAPAFELKILLDKELNLDSTLLQDKPNSGKTLIEKFEDYSNVDYAFIIVTPDDVGSLKNEQLRERARQNVILEWGHFVAKIGRGRTCVLLKGNIDLPSDMSGVCYLKFNDSVEEVFLKIRRELHTAGIIK